MNRLTHGPGCVKAPTIWARPLCLGLYLIRYNASGKGKREKLCADQERFALWSTCAAKFGKVAKCVAGAKSLRTTAQ